MHTTLLIMAAGMGSRYGGNGSKQVDQMGPHGEILMDYSVFDAMAAGFDKVVFVIKREMEATVRELIGDRLAQKVEVAYAYQEFANLPAGCKVPQGRTKPYGTVHAVLCARDVIHEPFAVINADDYYGKDAFAAIAGSLHGMESAKLSASMVAYDLSNTLSPNGGVTRGLCDTNARGELVSVTETYDISAAADGTVHSCGKGEQDVTVDPHALVSMNFWGLTPAFFDEAAAFLQEGFAAMAADDLKSEFPLPVLIDHLMHTAGLRVDVLSTRAVWFGVTNREDKAGVQAALARLHAEGAYPEKLF